MMYSSAIIGISAFAATALAQVTDFGFTNLPLAGTLAVGSTVPLIYNTPSSAAGTPSPPVTISLLTGCPENCIKSSDLTTTETSGTYNWVVNAPAGSKYGLQITLDGRLNYSNNFTISGGAAPPSSYAAPSSSAPSGSVSKIADGQPQAPSSFGSAPVISAPATSAYVYPTAPAYTPTVTPTPVQTPPARYTGAAAQVQVGAGALALAGLAAML